MNALLLALALGLAPSLHAAETDAANKASRVIRSYRFGACDYWQGISGDFGRSYACGIYPRNIVVADAYDVERELTAARDKITNLERRVQALEEKLAETR